MSDEDKAEETDAEIEVNLDTKSKSKSKVIYITHIVVLAIGLAIGLFIPKTSDFEDFLTYSMLDNEKEVKKLAKEGAENGDEVMQYFYYASLKGDDEDKEALEWLQKSADQDYAPAQHALAKFYFTGSMKGIKENKTEAIKWYKKAAENGQVTAMYELGKCAERGYGMVKNIKLARKYYQQAADFGFEDAIDRMNETFEKSKGDGGDDQ